MANALQALHKTLASEAAAIQQAIASNTGCTDTEAFVEYLLALSDLEEHYRSLDAETALKDEYAIARGEDFAERQDPIGIAYIVPTTYTLFYSTIVAVGAALAAGNCVVIEVYLASLSDR
ncbi:hypothetical protein MAP00_004943 [Monascus purpureus]|nr:hypothetical protein MAP00_004943 [Monascus purpureus]